jgi:hypothetical protein
MPSELREATAEESQRQELEMLEVHQCSATFRSHQASPNGSRSKSILALLVAFFI